MVGEQEGGEFVDNVLDMEDVPQIELPFRDDLSNDLKNLLRALVINQQNIISNTTFLFDRIKDFSALLQAMATELRSSDPRQPENPPRLEPVPEEA